MKKFFLVLVMVIFTAILFSCSSSDQKEEVKLETQQVASDTTKIAEGKAVCPACNMEMDKAEMLEADIDGQKLYFCNDNCKNHYLASKGEGEQHEHEGEKEKKTM